MLVTAIFVVFSFGFRLPLRRRAANDRPATRRSGNVAADPNGYLILLLMTMMIADGRCVSPYRDYPPPEILRPDGRTDGRRS